MSSHVVSLAAKGLLHFPVWESHSPFVKQGPAAKHFTSAHLSTPLQTWLLSQMSSKVTASPSSQASPLFFGFTEHLPVLWSQRPTKWQVSGASQVTPAHRSFPAHTPFPSQTSSTVTSLPS